MESDDSKSVQGMFLSHAFFFDDHWPIFFEGKQEKSETGVQQDVLKKKEGIVRFFLEILSGLNILSL